MICSSMLAQLFATSPSSLTGVVIGLLVACAAVVTCVLILVRINRLVTRIKAGAARFAAGDLSQPLPVEGPPELAGLAEALNRMARQLDERLGTVISQRNELQGVLASMIEGVLAIDGDERVLSLNQAAAELLDVEVHKALGRPVLELVRNVGFQQFLGQCLANNKPVQGTLVLRVPLQQNGRWVTPDRLLQAQGSPLHDASGHRLGVLIVLHDVTELRRLEGVRRDFVANVSHEIKTPVAAIKAAAETLEDTIVGDDEDGLKFLAIIARQADRLNALMEDLLALARIEQEADQQKIATDAGNVFDVVEAAQAAVQAEADEKNIRITTTCPSQVQVLMSAHLLERALVNLLANAIKYSPAQTEVRLVVEETEKEVVIAVYDQGPGIEPEHLSRVFERFYRVDKARSRKVGGTGLGLAIVKHVATAHRGRVGVESVPGKGSVFRIHLPRL